MTRRALGQPGSTVSLYSLVRGLEGPPLLHRSACGAGCFAGPDGKGGAGLKVPERGGTLLQAIRLHWGSQTELLREENSQAGPGGGPSPAHAA